MTGMPAIQATVGFLYPGYAAEDDYRRAETLLGSDVELPLVHTSVGEDAHRVDALLDLGGQDRLEHGAEQFRGRGLDALIWACTSGSFVFGWDGARAQADAAGKVLGVPASSTSFAFVHAAQALGVRRVAVAATYPKDVADRFADFLAVGGIEVVQMASRGIVTATEVSTLGRKDVLAFTVEGDHPDADAVLLPDTALHSVCWVDELEACLGKPVLTANQVSIWEGLQLAGDRRRYVGVGALFAT